MMELSQSWQPSDETFHGIESFVCHLYGKKHKDVDLLRYELHCAKGGKVEPEDLPPCRSSLKLHALRANYQAAIWRRAIFPQPEIPSPHDHGWKINNDNNETKIVWLGTEPAPNEVLELLFCTCRRACSEESFCCMKAGLKCTDMCYLQYENMASYDDDDDTLGNDKDENVDL